MRCCGGGCSGTALNIMPAGPTPASWNSWRTRVPFSEVAKPLLADRRFLQPHRSDVVNLAAASQLSVGELWMRSGARVPIPRGREAAVRAAFRKFLER